MRKLEFEQPKVSMFEMKEFRLILLCCPPDGHRYQHLTRHRLCWFRPVLRQKMDALKYIAKNFFLLGAYGHLTCNPENMPSLQARRQVFVLQPWPHGSPDCALLERGPYVSTPKSRCYCQQVCQTAGTIQYVQYNGELRAGFARRSLPNIV